MYLNGSIKRFSNTNHNWGKKDPEYVIEEQSNLSNKNPRHRRIKIKSQQKEACLELWKINKSNTIRYSEIKI
jgi:hypothetical protein